MNQSENSKLIKRIAKEIGFDFCGISKAEFLEDEAKKLEQWLNENRHGKMKYMENHFDKRLNPSLLFPGTLTVVSLLLNYYPDAKQNVNAPKVSKYAYGDDYHTIIKSKCLELISRLQEAAGEIQAKCYVDSAPVMDKVWAKKSGLGWIGKNSNLISKGNGSFFFIAEVLLDLKCEPDGPIKDYCGTCTLCIDSCPTDAIIEPYVVDSTKCISYLTIELKDEIESQFKGKMENWIFGCDICQDVCPWNRFSKSNGHKWFDDKTGLTKWESSDWELLDEESFRKIFKNSAIKRTKFKGLMRNIQFLKNNTL